jgi:hypothetical protein
MSWLSQFLGLDKHPALLAEINTAGQAAAIAAANAAAAPEANTAAAAVESVTTPIAQKVAAALPIDPGEQGLAFLWLTSEVKQGINGALAKLGYAPNPTLPGSNGAPV